MMQGPNHPRMRGVGQAPTPADGRGSPRTVANVVPMEQYAVQYFDENGTPRVNVLVKVGDQFYFPPNGIDWAASLKPAAEWVKKGVLAKIGNGQSVDPLPKSDAVDVMAGEEDDADDSSAQ